eukprot:scaffold109954_cov28-Tisochrysis_lutea.AAC.2
MACDVTTATSRLALMHRGLPFWVRQANACNVFAIEVACLCMLGMVGLTKAMKKRTGSQDSATGC